MKKASLRMLQPIFYLGIAISASSFLWLVLAGFVSLLSAILIGFTVLICTAVQTVTYKEVELQQGVLCRSPGLLMLMGVATIWNGIAGPLALLGTAVLMFAPQLVNGPSVLYYLCLPSMLAGLVVGITAVVLGVLWCAEDKQRLAAQKADEELKAKALAEDGVQPEDLKIMQEEHKLKLLREEKAKMLPVVQPEPTLLLTAAEEPQGEENIAEQEIEDAAEEPQGEEDKAEREIEDAAEEPQGEEDKGEREIEDGAEEPQGEQGRQADSDAEQVQAEIPNTDTESVAALADTPPQQNALQQLVGWAKNTAAMLAGVFAKQAASEALEEQAQNQQATDEQEPNSVEPQGGQAEAEQEPQDEPQAQTEEGGMMEEVLELQEQAGQNDVEATEPEPEAATEEAKEGAQVEQEAVAASCDDDTAEDVAEPTNSAEAAQTEVEQEIEDASKEPQAEEGTAEQAPQAKPQETALQQLTSWAKGASKHARILLAGFVTREKQDEGAQQEEAKAEAPAELLEEQIKVVAEDIAEPELEKEYAEALAEEPQAETETVVAEEVEKTDEKAANENSGTVKNAKTAKKPRKKKKPKQQEAIADSTDEPQNEPDEEQVETVKEEHATEPEKKVKKKKKPKEPKAAEKVSKDKKVSTGKAKGILQTCRLESEQARWASITMARFFIKQGLVEASSAQRQEKQEDK